MWIQGSTRHKAVVRGAISGLVVVGLAVVGSGLPGGSAGAAPGGSPRAFSPETAAGYTNTFSVNEVLSPKCPEALAATPGSDPASKVLNNALNTAASFKPGGTVHYTYLDNPHPNGGTQNFTIQDCVVTYPAGFFTAADFDPVTGVLTSDIKKNQLTKGGTQIDGAALSGINSSQGKIYYAWTAPATVTPGTWVCNFARDIKNNHGGGGNRKVPPTCYQVPPPPATTTTSTSTSTTTTAPPQRNVTPDIFLGYADDLHGSQFFPTPWQGAPGVTFVGCTFPTIECPDYDAGAIRVDNPLTNSALTLVDAYVDIGPCHFHPWDALLGSVAGPGASFILTQTGLLGPPQAAPCDGRVEPSARPITNFDTSEGPFDTIDPPFSNCDPNLVPLPVIHLVFTSAIGGMTLDITDAAKILNTGGVDRFACSGGEEATPWTAVPPVNVVRT